MKSALENTPQSPQKKTTNNRLALWAGLGVLALVGIVIWVVKHPKTSAPVDTEVELAPVKVQLASAKLGPIETLVDAQGTLLPGPGTAAKVSVVAAGRLKSVLVREGDKVRKGQLLALVDDAAQVSAQKSAQAALQGALADEQSADASILSAQSDQNSGLKNAQIALKSALTSRNADVVNAKNALAQAQSDLRKARVGAAQFDLDNAVSSAQLALKTARSSRDADVLNAKNALAQTQTELAKTQNGPLPQEIAAAQAAVNQAQATQDRAEKEVTRVQFLEAKGIRARRDVEDAQTALDVAKAGTQSARDALQLLQNVPRKEDLQAAQLKVQSAQQALNAAQNAGDARVAQELENVRLALANRAQGAKSRPQDVQSALLKVEAAREALNQAQKLGDDRVTAAQATLEAARNGAQVVNARRADAQSKKAAVQSRLADLQAAQAQTQTTQIRAPIDGTISKRNLNSGEVADTTVPVVEITNNAALTLSAKVPPEDGAQIKGGQTVRLQSDAAPGKVFAGRVLSIGSIDPQSNLQTVQIAVFDAAQSLQNGAFANAKVVTSRHPLAVLIPKGALLSRDGKTVVMTDEKDIAKEHDVETGAAVGDIVEIKSGLRPGAKVIVSGQYELEDGAKLEAGTP